MKELLKKVWLLRYSLENRRINIAVVLDLGGGLRQEMLVQTLEGMSYDLLVSLVNTLHFSSSLSI